MKYIMVCVLGGETQCFHQKLVKEIHDLFDADVLYCQKAPTHFTLKDPFEIDDISELEKMLAEFCAANPPSPIQVKAFNRFEDDVIFMNIHMSEEALAIYQNLLGALRTLEWMQWSSFDGENRHFHLSLAYFDISEKYKEICRHLEQYTYAFNAYFDNITLYRGDYDAWTFYKSFYFSGIKR